MKGRLRASGSVLGRLMGPRWLGGARAVWACLIFVSLAACSDPEPVYVGADEVSSMAATADGVYVAGHPETSGDDDTGVYLRRYDADGEVAWTRYVDTPPYETSAAVAAAAGGHAYLLSSDTESPAQPYPPSFCTLRKYSPSGEVLWTVKLSEAGDACDYGKVVASAGGVYVLGTATGNRVRNYDTNGTLVWTKSYDLDPESRAYRLAADETGRLYLTGPYGDAGMFILELSGEGERLSQRNVGFRTSGFSVLGEDSYFVDRRELSRAAEEGPRSAVHLVKLGCEGVVWDKLLVEQTDPNLRSYLVTTEVIATPAGPLVIFSYPVDSFLIFDRVRHVLLSLDPDGNERWRKDVAYSLSALALLDGTDAVSGGDTVSRFSLQDGAAVWTKVNR